MTHNEIEEALVRAFVVPERSERYIEGLASPKRRSKILSRLHHHIPEIDAAWRTALPKGRRSIVEIAAMLRARGAPDKCYVICSDPELDRREMPLEEALDNVVGQGMGTLISCVHGKLGFYESEESGQRFILERQKR